MKTLREIIETYCVNMGGECWYLGFDEHFYTWYMAEIDKDIVFHQFHITFFDETEKKVDLWRKDIKLHTFTDPEKLESFILSLDHKLIKP